MTPTQTEPSSRPTRSEVAAVAAALGRMFASFRERAEDAEGLTRAYASTLDDLPAWAIVRACEAFARGRVPDRHNSAFAPSAAEIHQCADGLLAEEERHRRLLNPPKQLPAPPRLSREAALKGAAILDAFAGELRGDTVDHAAEKRRSMWQEMGPRLWDRFGHDTSRLEPSAELEELIRSKPPTEAEREAA